MSRGFSGFCAKNSCEEAGLREQSRQWMLWECVIDMVAWAMCNAGTGGKCLASGCVLKVKPQGFSRELAVGCERNSVNDCSRGLVPANERKGLLSVGIRESEVNGLGKLSQSKWGHLCQSCQRK